MNCRILGGPANLLRARSWGTCAAHEATQDPQSESKNGASVFVFLGGTAGAFLPRKKIRPKALAQPFMKAELLRRKRGAVGFSFPSRPFSALIPAKVTSALPLQHAELAAPMVKLDWGASAWVP
jgi:hypothetical protein